MNDGDFRSENIENASESSKCNELTLLIVSYVDPGKLLDLMACDHLAELHRRDDSNVVGKGCKALEE